VKVTVLTTTFPRHRNDPCGQFIASLLASLPFQFEVVCPSDSALGPLDLPRVQRRMFRNAGVFYGSGGVANWREKRAGVWAVATTLFSMSATALRAASHSAVIWSHWAVPAGLIGALCRLLLRRRHILLLHSADVWLLERMPGGRLLARFIAAHTDEILGVSQDLVARFAHLSGRRGRVLSCGIEPNPFFTARYASAHTPLHTSQRAPARVGTLSRLVPSKGALALAEWADAIAGGLAVAGDGPEATALSELSRRTKNLVYRGPLVGHAKHAFLAELAVFAAPYTRTAWGQQEGLPTAVLEAMAAGCAVVAFRGAVPMELLRHGENGLLVPDEDFVGMTHAINHLLSDSTLCTHLGEAARRSAEPYLLPHISREWARVLAAKPAPRNDTMLALDPGRQRT